MEITKEQYLEACTIRREYLKQNPVEGMFQALRSDPEFSEYSDEELWESIRAAAHRYLKQLDINKL